MLAKPSKEKCHGIFHSYYRGIDSKNTLCKSSLFHTKSPSSPFLIGCHHYCLLPLDVQRFPHPHLQTRHSAVPVQASGSVMVFSASLESSNRILGIYLLSLLIKFVMLCLTLTGWVQSLIRYSFHPQF